MAHETVQPFWQQALLALGPAVVVLIGVVVTLIATTSRERRLRVHELRLAAYFDYQLAVSDFLAAMDEHDWLNAAPIGGMPLGGAPLLPDGEFVDAPMRRELVRVEVYGSKAVRDAGRDAIRMLRRAAVDRSKYDEGPLLSVRNKMRKEIGADRG